MAARTLLTLVRHGETSANVEGVWHGSIDTQLTPRGLRQAQRVAERIADLRPAPVALYSSPQRRACDTALAIAERLGLDHRLDADLVEYRLGLLEGTSYRELIARHRLFARMREDPDYAPEGAESPRQVATRCAQALRRIASAHPGQRIVVVGHGGALALSLGLLLDDEAAAWQRVMDNAAVTELALAEDAELVTFNRTDHLEGV